MKKRVRFSLFLSLFLLSLCTLSYAKTSDEYLKDIYSLVDKKQYDKALTAVRKALLEYPTHIELAFTIAEVYRLRGDYEVAIQGYINLARGIESEGEKIDAIIHHRLIDTYNELGQKHYFSKELCFRIIYHTEKELELEPKLSQDSRFIEFLRKSLGHYDMANMGAKMMETGGDGAEFQLPDDYVSADNKLLYKNKATQGINDYDALQKASAMQTVASDKTVAEIIGLINQKVSVIKSVHFKKMNAVGVNLIEEITYKSPDSLKVVQPKAISILKNDDYYVVDPQSNKILEQDHIDMTKMSLLKELGFDNPWEALELYYLSIEKINGCPDFLNELCRVNPLNLYLITGKLKDPDKGPYPPTPKVEYFIDSYTGLCVAKREYWLGILGSGKEEELAKETIVTNIGLASNGISFASTGLTRGLVKELKDLNEDWNTTVLAINQEINDQEFNVAK